jgi:hypothetical protein
MPQPPGPLTTSGNRLRSFAPENSLLRRLARSSAAARSWPGTKLLRFPHTCQALTWWHRTRRLLQRLVMLPDRDPRTTYRRQN